MRSRFLAVAVQSIVQAKVFAHLRGGTKDFGSLSCHGASGSLNKLKDATPRSDAVGCADVKRMAKA